ncbi:hypothetical protein IE53DRAFT_370331 [Violaceomyces palustris]|uniref:Uncharacterized protein n=1 Tax=Violaceomyces palustris TaxID=1673888 RepID=A0ACD0NSF0_9BASI|nr:hypothetical protein IE53DRAFT_370331 [Violaceomyces palustris]
MSNDDVTMREHASASPINIAPLHRQSPLSRSRSRSQSIYSLQRPRSYSHAPNDGYSPPPTSASSTSSPRNHLQDDVFMDQDGIPHFMRSRPPPSRSLSQSNSHSHSLVYHHSPPLGSPGHSLATSVLLHNHDPSSPSLCPTTEQVVNSLEAESEHHALSLLSRIRAHEDREKELEARIRAQEEHVSQLERRLRIVEDERDELRKQLPAKAKVSSQVPASPQSLS